MICRPFKKRERKTLHFSIPLLKILLFLYNHKICSDIKIIKYLQEMTNGGGVIEDKLVTLKGVRGTFRPGVLTGAEKTTLMEV